eukprot:TRINITY_DN5423_c0_g2_i1.p1 TRINITY_DN5423_c0_g2~~TRINITY_DN5423_c0_g2_i1.p1  ORF type:complete len:645 (+),score=177.75 TRINITY_DN5423_c0_g2_i1:576-2510(+)
MPGALLSIEDAIAAQSFLEPVEGKVIQCGEPIDDALSGCEHVVEGEMKLAGQEHFYLETQASLVIPHEGCREFEVISSTQNPTKTQMVVAHALGLPASRVKCSVRRLGGGFGGKETRNIYVSSALAVAALTTKRAVRLQLSRDDDMGSSGMRHPYFGKYRVGFSSDGLISVVDHEIYSNGGHTQDLTWPSLERAMFHTDNAYKIPHFRVHARACKTNLPSNTAFRGFGGPQGMMMMETVIEHVARHCGLPTHVVQARNMYQQDMETHYGMKILDGAKLSRCVDQVMTELDYEAARAAADSFNSTHRHRKRGLAMTPVKFGMSFTASFMNQASALVHVYQDGTVLVNHGGTEMGQGLHTKMCQVAATAFGLPLTQVYVENTSTDKCANTSPTAASVSADMNGAAVKNACDTLLERLAPIREKMPPDASFSQISNAAFFQRVDMTAHGHYYTEGVGFDFETRVGKPFHYFSYGAAVSEVEVDTLTGDFHVLRSSVVHDCGKSLNPALDIGQVEGAFVQGMGYLTTEEPVWFTAGPNAGKMLTRGPGAYKIPSFNDIPLDFRVKLLEGSEQRSVVHSSKGVGEPPLFLGASVFFAIRDAIQAARSDAGVEGFFRLDAPASAERIRMACVDQLTARFVDKDFVPNVCC